MGKSKFVISILLGFLLGVYLGDLFRIEPAWLFGVLFGLIMALIFNWQLFYWRLSLLAIIGFMIGLIYVQHWQIREENLVLPYDREVEIEANIIKHPDFLASQSRYLLMYNKAKIELETGRYPEYQYGDRLKIKGVIKKPSAYLSHQNIAGQIVNGQIQKTGSGGSPRGGAGNLILKNIYHVRDKFEETLNKVFNEPLASFAAGLVLGSKRNIPDSLVNDFNRTGTTHIIAVSGYNVTILIVYLGIVFGLISRRLKIWGTLAVIIGFVLMTGATASVVRAGILAGLVIFGKSQGRRINMTILVLLTATIMVILCPNVLKYDVSFQLSFLAFLGLVYLSPKISKVKLISKIYPPVRATLAETLGAQIMVLPILVFYFGQASLVAPLVNILILWIIPFSMLMVFLAAISGQIAIGLGHWVGFFGAFPLKYIIEIVRTFSKLPWASWQIKTSQWWWMPLYFLIIAIWLYSKREGPNETHVQTF